MTRIEKLLRALQASQVMPDAGNAKPAPVVDVAAAGVIIVKLSGGSLDGKHDTLEGALSRRSRRPARSRRPGSRTRSPRPTRRVEPWRRSMPRWRRGTTEMASPSESDNGKLWKELNALRATVEAAQVQTTERATRALELLALSVALPHLPESAAVTDPHRATIARLAASIRAASR